MPSKFLIETIWLRLLIKKLIKRALLISRLIAQGALFLVSAKSGKLIVKLKVT